MPRNTKKIIIDMETLDIYPTLGKVAKELGVTRGAVCKSILEGYRCRKRKFEYLDYWIGLTDKQKEQYSRKNNIYFLRGNAKF